MATHYVFAKILYFLQISRTSCIFLVFLKKHIFNSKALKMHMGHLCEQWTVQSIGNLTPLNAEPDTGARVCRVRLLNQAAVCHLRAGYRRRLCFHSTRPLFVISPHFDDQGSNNKRASCLRARAHNDSLRGRLAWWQQHLSRGVHPKCVWVF